VDPGRVAANSGQIPPKSVNLIGSWTFSQSSVY